MVTEGAVIVASILLAFGIEAGWSERQDRSDLRDLVALVRADIASDVTLMTESNARADSVIAKLEELIALGAPDSVLPPEDSLASLAIASWQASTFTPSIAALDVAAASPVWDRIPEEIQVELSEYRLGSNAENVRIGQTALETLIDLSGDHGGLGTLLRPTDVSFATQPLSGAGLASFTRSPRVQSWLVIHHAMMTADQAWRAEWIDRLEGLSEGLGDVVGDTRSN
jgi:hypothetical protein